MNGIIRPYKIIALIAVSLSLLACGSKKGVWAGIHTFSGNVWMPEEYISFTPDSAVYDDVQADRIILSLRCSQNFRYNEIPLAMEIENGGDRLFLTDTLTFKIPTETKRGGASGKYGLREIADTLRLTDPLGPGTVVTLRQLDSKPLNEIYDLTLKLEPEE